MESVIETLRRARRQWQVSQSVLRTRVRQTADTLESRLRQAAHSTPVHNAWSRAAGQVPKADWMTLARPALWDERTALRRVAEPVVAVVAASVLAAMGSLAVASLVGFIFACLIAIAILTQVLGFHWTLICQAPRRPKRRFAP